MILIMGLSSPLFIQLNAEEEYLVIGIVDANYPPRIIVYEDRHFTAFSFFVTYQIFNPTSSQITIPYVCAPYPFPYLRTNLRDKNLEVTPLISVEIVAGETTLNPGYKNRSIYIAFNIRNFINDSLPLGIYEMWLDYTNCSTSPIPVVTERMFVDVTETDITYYFDYINESRVVSSVQQTNYTQSLFILTSILMVAAFRIQNQKRKRL